MAGDGLMLAASVWGPADGMPVLFFHGGGQSRRAWGRAARRLGAAGYRAFSFDLRGHGDSDWAPDGDYLLAAYGRDVAALVAGFDRKVVLVGASRGGQSCLVAAAGKPDKVALLFLADIVPEVHDAGVARMKAFFAASVHGFADLDEAADALAAHFDRPRAPTPVGLGKAMIRRGGRYYWQWDPRTASVEFINPPSEAETLLAAAASIRVPVVMVRAEHSEFVSDASVARFQALTPQLEVELAAGAHHMLTADSNDGFAARLLDRLGMLQA